LQITGIHRAGNTIVTGTGCVLATAVNTGIRGTVYLVVAVTIGQAVDTGFMGFITHQWRCTGISTFLTARNGIAGLSTVAVITIVTEGITGCILTAELAITGVYRAGNTIVTGHVTGYILAIVLYITGIRRAGNTIITGPVTGGVLATILGITGVRRAGNTIITGPVTGIILAATTNTGIRSTANCIIAVPVS